MTAPHLKSAMADPLSHSDSNHSFAVNPLAPKITVLGIGQMGMVCSAIISESQAGPLSGRAGTQFQSSKKDSLNGTNFAQPAPIVRPIVRLWGHNADDTANLAQARRSDRLPGMILPDNIKVTIKAREALADADVIISAIPVQYSRSVWDAIAGFVPPKAAILSVAKGIENGTLLRPTQIIAEVLADNPDTAARPLGTLSGPTIASELARCLPATMVAASDNEDFRKYVQVLFTTRWMRIYTSQDLIGVELAGAMKNVIAIAAGILDGLAAGSNAKSALLSRGLAEISRLGLAMGASPDTFFGITGVGDLATSCFSPEGRNRTCGEALGRGKKLDDYLAHSRSVVEGVATTRSVVDLAHKFNVDMPITTAVHAVLFEGTDAIDAIGQLMNRERKEERIG